MEPASTTRATTKQGTLLYQHVLGTRNSQDKLIFGREFRGELLTGDDLFGGTVTDDGRYLVIRDRPRRAGKARGHCVPRPDQAGLALRGAGMGAGFAVRGDLCQRARGT